MSRPHKHYGKWRIRWIDERGVRRSKVFDARPDALLELHRIKLAVAEAVRRGVPGGTPSNKTVGDVAAYWLEHRAPLKRSEKDDRSILRQLSPYFDHVPVIDVPALVVAVDGYAKDKASLSKKTLANHLSLLQSLLRLAVDLGWAPRAPRLRKPRVSAASTDFQYLRTADDISRLLEAAEAEGQLVATLYAMAIYTGLRAGELAGLRWSDISFQQRLVTVHRSFDGPTKAEDVRYVPIVDALLDRLERWRSVHEHELVFTNRDGAMLRPSGRVFQETLHRVLARAGLPPRTVGTRVRPFMRFHDFRHTFASHWVMRGGSLFKLQKVLGHKTVQMTMRYAHLQPAAFREDYARFGPSSGAEAHGIQREDRTSAS